MSTPTVPTPQSFGEKLAEAMANHGPLCLGIDPHPYLLEQWGLPVNASGLETFSLRVVEAVAETPVAALKPQVAFYERFGSAGFAVLERVLAEAKAAGVLTIADAKRGDIGSTMAGYAEAWLADDSPLAADSVTLSPYLGFESLRPALEMAYATGRGVFVLGLTSNPEGAEVQYRGHDPQNGGKSVAKIILDHIVTENSAQVPDKHELEKGTGGSRKQSAIGSLGVVIGATIARKARDLGIDLKATRAPLLAPGFGAQGASAEDLRDGFGDAWPQVLVNSSRAILQRGPELAGLREAISQTLDSPAHVPPH